MEKLQKRICYLICVYNDQQGLETSLTSIFADDPLADILVIDDGSTPAVTLPDIPLEFNIALKRQEPNGGLIAALNEGLELILGQPYDYIARLDAGDTVNRGRLNAQLLHMDDNPEIGILGTQLRAFDKDTDETLFFFNNPVGKKRVARMLKVRNVLAHPSVMIRSTVVDYAGYYDPNYKYGEDYEMWRRMAQFCDVDNLAEVYVNKEISSTQITAMNRRASSFTKLKAQMKYFKLLNIYCWAGFLRTLGSLIISRDALVSLKKKVNKNDR